MQMNIDELTIGDARELSKLFGARPFCDQGKHSFKIGTCYLIRTVTYHFIGKLVAITDTDMVLDDVCWLADSGKFSKALEIGSVDEAEAVPDGHVICRGGIIDAAIWLHKVPGTQ